MFKSARTLKRGQEKVESVEINVYVELVFEM